ncbi:MAG TPA: hypothetical protein PK605_03255 [Ignavibacteria bacterium]|nr:hypothetical protein [Bacteroidota bacterium]HRE11897.1 hypothetical protein [Ignavibacteria bacterium]HRF64974.1 hypothetical protein [Ignavibacteria bacterium]HRJ03401.1 hypothetical protein [Ignavibacteria bacterium]HRJ85540.1 hypothetical protein [Ignavibacteria bacterium]
MRKVSKIYRVLFALVIAVMLYSCGSDTAVNTVNETILYEEQGLVDSAVVTGCYAYTRSHFLRDTFNFSSYNMIKIEFDGLSTSDYSTISVLSNNAIITNEVLYRRDNDSVNNYHSFEVPSPGDSVWIELRLYMNPQVCGTNEFKFIRARDLKVTGIK